MKLYLICIFVLGICLRKCVLSEVVNETLGKEDNVNSVIYDIGSQSNPVNGNVLVSITENKEKTESNNEATDLNSENFDMEKVNEGPFTSVPFLYASDSNEKVQERINENNVIKATPESTLVDPNSPSYKIFTAFMNFLIELSVLFLGASLIMMVVILIKKKSLPKLNLNNSQYDLIPNNKTEINVNSDDNTDSENTDNTDKVIDDKLLESQLYDSNYELMATEIEDIQEERICIRDF